MIWRGEQGLKSQIWYLKEERERESKREREKPAWSDIERAAQYNQKQECMK